MQRWITALVFALALALPARAHFIFLVPDAAGRVVQAVFSEELAPDANVPITKIAATKLYARGQDKAPLAMKQAENAYAVTLPDGASTVGGTCVYGVLAKGGAEPYLLQYHPKAVLGTSAEAVRREAGQAWDKLPLEILVTGGQGKAIAGVVTYRGKPAAGAEVIATTSTGEPRNKVETDADGRFVLPGPFTTGLLSVRARHVEEKAGTHDGKEYQQAKHYATLVMPILSAASARAGETSSGQEDPAATKLLRDARQARAAWKDFPGFRADLELNRNGEVTRGSVTVRDNGKTELEGFADEEAKKWVRGQVASLVAHRLDTAGDRETPCAFADGVKDHPLGRKIHVLNDELHSSYRIRDRQIVEVSRQMGEKVRFKITVLKNTVTPEKRFLPSSYVVNTWDAQTGRLVSSTAFHHTWNRQGGYDLPETVLVVTAGGERPERNVSTAGEQTGDALDVRELRFRGIKLLAE